jgi:Family of unknown function (DUF6144)
MPFRVQRFESSLKIHVDKAAKIKLMKDLKPYDTLKTPSQTANWIRSMMDRLDDAVGVNVAGKVMEACGRQCIGRSVLEKAGRFQQNSTDLDDLLDQLNQARIGGGNLHRKGDLIHASYDRCYCGSVSKTRQPISITYCKCSCGWYQLLFETLLGKPVEVELIDSIIHGGAICQFVTHI